jgi:virginiamycin B lyase
MRSEFSSSVLSSAAKSLGTIDAGRLFRFWLWTSLALSAVAQTNVSFHSFPTPINDGVNPMGITSGPDGALWFAGVGGVSAIFRLATDGTCSKFRTNQTSSAIAPRMITTGHDGNLWFTAVDPSRIGRVTPAGEVTLFPSPIGPDGIAAGSDGAIWFTRPFFSSIGRITSSGAITEYSLPDPSSSPQTIVAGPDGNLWFTEVLGNRIGRMTPTGTLTEFAIPTAGSWPWGITVGPDGNLWFSESVGRKIGRITPSGVITEYGGLNGRPFALTAGPDGAVWFLVVNNYNGRLERITTSGTIVSFTGPGRIDDHSGLTTGPDGALWYSSPNARSASFIIRAGILSILTESLPAGVSGAAYSYQLSSFGASANAQWSAIGLPNGLTLSGAGVLSGTPLESGSFSVRISLLDNGDARLQTTADFSLTISPSLPPAGALSVSTTSIPKGTVGVGYSHTLSATGGTPPYSWTVALGTLPDGLSLGMSSGILAGSPTAEGVSSFVVAVTDRAAATATRLLQFTAESAIADIPRAAVFSHIAAGAGWKTSLYLVNESSALTSVNLVFWSDNGGKLELPLSVTQTGGTETVTAASLPASIAPHSTLLVECAGPSSTGVTGWAEILSKTAIHGYGVFHYTSPGGTESEATVPLETSQHSTLQFPYEVDSGFTAGLALANLSATEAKTISTRVCAEGGACRAQSSFTLPSGGHKSFMLTDLSLVSAGRRGYLEFSSSGESGIAGVGIRVNPMGGLTSTMPLATPQRSANRAGVFSQVAAGAGWKTSLYLLNPTSAQSSATIKFWTDEGSAMTLPVAVLDIRGTSTQNAASVNVTLAPYSTVLIDCSSESPNGLTGWAEVVSATSLSGYGVFHYTSPQGIESEGTVPMDGDLESGFVLPFEATNQFGMGVALTNLASSQTTTVKITLWDENGAALAGTNVDLPPAGHTSFMLNDRIPATANTRGFLQFTSIGGASITGLGIRVNPEGGFTSAPKL